MTADRRRFLGAAAGAVVMTGATVQQLWPKHSIDYRKPRSLVAVLNCDTYSERLEELLLDSFKLFPIHVRGKSVLLKPNLVEDLPGPVNTNPTLIVAAARCFLRLGARRIVVGEGPGHQRDTAYGSKNSISLITRYIVRLISKAPMPMLRGFLCDVT